MDDEDEREEESASATEDDEEDDEADDEEDDGVQALAASEGDQTDEEDSDGGGKPRRSVSQRLPKRPVHEANNEGRTLDSLRQEVDGIATSLATAQAAALKHRMPLSL